MKNEKIIDIFLPELGEGISSVEISDILVKTGDFIKNDDPIIVVETEKASMEIPSSNSGSIIDILVEKGASISPGDKIVSLDSEKQNNKKDELNSVGSEAQKSISSENEIIKQDTQIENSNNTELYPADSFEKFDILLPELGEGISSVEISDILVKKGDFIKNDDPIIVVETEKASMEIPSSNSGSIIDILVEKGTSISPGEIIITINSKKEFLDNKDLENNKISKQLNSDLIELKSESNKEIPSSLNENNFSTKSSFGKPVLASPSVRLFSRELGCDLKLVSGTGKKGRITKEDVQKYIKLILSGKSSKYNSGSVENIINNIDFTKWGEVSSKPLNKIKKITGVRLQQAWQSIPHVTQFDKCDITSLEQNRVKMKNDNKYKNLKISLIPFFIKALIILLKKYPHFNSSLDENKENLILKNYFNIGIAVDTPNGLLVPVIKDLENKSIEDISIELSSLSKKAREKKLLPKDMEGSCFTISSLGGIGGTYFTPIINPPEVAIIGISRSEYKQVYKDNQFQKRLILPYSLSYDHRVIDGADAAKFTSEFGLILENLKEII